MARVLVVEDDVTLSNAYRMILEKDKHDVELAKDGEEGLKKAELFDPEIILLDLLMPGMGGMDFLQRYQPLQLHPEVKIVILSNLGDEKLVAHARELGAEKYIVKAHTTPGQMSLLVKRLSKDKRH